MNKKVAIGMEYAILKTSAILLFSLLFLTYFNYPCYAANLDDLYKPILKDNRYLYEGNFYYFREREKGVHGEIEYDEFDSSVYFYHLNNSLRYSPTPCLELAIGIKETFPATYERLTYDASGNLTTTQDYDLDYFRDYKLNIRMRSQNVELFLDILEKRQKSHWNYASLPNPPNYFSYIQTHYEDIDLGLRYLSEIQDPVHKTNLSKLRRPLLQDNQTNIEAELEYKNGKLKRTSHYNVNGRQIYNFSHNLKPHLSNKIILRYGLDNNLELESGIFYTTPFKYEYGYRLFYPDGTSNFITGEYKLKHNFYFPFNLRYRLKDNVAFSLSSDFNFINQRLDYWQKNKDDTITSYPTKKLNYYNTKPTLRLTYLYDEDKDIKDDEFSSLTKKMLLKNQFLIEFLYQRDITHLSKNLSNGPQNIIDPYNVFLYPLEYFVVGSEYAAFFCGNTSRFATNVMPQNYNLLQTNFIYGLSDSINLGLIFGYRSGSRLHHFTLNDLARRAYKFRYNLFFDFLFDWRLTKNSLLSLTTHFVPNYTTLFEGYSEEFKSKNKYLGVSLNIQILF